jgi:hypothetical protein
MSVVSVFDAPVYFFGWAAVILSMIYLLAAKRWKLWREVETPLTVSATVMVPASLVIVLLFGAGHISQLHQGITVLLAAGFYAMACWLSAKEEERRGLFTVANSLLALGTVLVAYDVSNSLTTTAFWLSIVSAAQLGAMIFYKRDVPKTWVSSISWLSAISMVIATFIAAASADWTMLSWLIGWQIAVHTAAAWYLRATIHMALGLLGVLLLPFVFGFMAITPAIGADVVAPVYLAIGLALMVLARQVNKVAPNYRSLTLVAYASAWVIAWLVGNLGVVGGAPTWLPTVATLSVASAAVLSAYYEKRAMILYCGTVALFFGAFQWLSLESLAANYLAVALTIGTTGLVMYGLGKLQQRTPNLHSYWQPWAWSGLGFLYLGSIYSILGAWFSPGQTLWAGAAYLFAAGAITSFESYKMKDKTGLYFGGAVIIAAIQFKLYQLGLREWQVYWYIWAAYPIAIAYIESAPAAIYFGTVLATIGLGQGISQRMMIDTQLISILFLLLAGAYYAMGKVHEYVLGDKHRKLGNAWTISGVVALYFVSILPNWWWSAVGDALINALALMAAGAATSYEAYRRNSRVGLYIGGGVSLLGLQWLMHMNNIQEFQIYSHMWALYFALLAWLGHKDGRQNEKTGFTITALVIQTLPLASQALAGDANYGLLLLVESVLIMAFGLYIRYKLVSQWGLVVGVLSVLYQLRDYQFFTLVLLGAGVIGFGVYMLMRGEKRGGPSA